MSLPTLADFKLFLRVTGDALDVPLTLALGAGVAESSALVGFDIGDRFNATPLPSDIEMACMLLGQSNVDAGTPAECEHRRGAAHRLLRPYREEVGIA